MKKLICLIFLTLPVQGKAQLYFNGKSEEQLNIKKHVVVSINRGWNDFRLVLEERPSIPRRFLTDKEGKELRFDNERDILDFLDKKGWEFKGALDVIEGNGRDLVFIKVPVMIPPDKL